MKTILILSLAACAAAVTASAQTVAIPTLDHVSVNGGPPMSVVYAAANYKEARAAIDAKVSQYETALIARANAAEAAAQEARDQLQVNITNQLEVVNAAKAALSNASLSDAQKVAAFMAVVAVAEQKRDEREAARIRAEADRLEAEAAAKRAQAEELTRPDQ